MTPHFTQHQQSVERQSEALRRALGAEILAALKNPQVIEIMLNPDSSLWVDCLGLGMQQIGYIEPIGAMSIIATVAAMRDTVVSDEQPILECELPLDGSRFEALIPPLVERASFALRKLALAVFTLAEYTAQGIVTPAQIAVIEHAIGTRQSVLITGGTGTGKTTLANALLNHIAEVAPSHRLVILEDTRELQCKAPRPTYQDRVKIGN